VVAHTCHPSYAGKYKLEDYASSWLGNRDPILTITNVKSAARVTQEVKNLPINHKALRSNIQYYKKNQTKQKGSKVVTYYETRVSYFLDSKTQLNVNSH
jgi:glucose-6-phosphate isomerase